ncbi:MAG: NADH-ubiquinone oxidoreductase-F iron-sulfur binding region domain-containing protein [Actinomycetota bacterium]
MATPLRRTHHALPEHPVATLNDHVDAGGLVGLFTARRQHPDATIELITEAGIRGRGGAGFPTGRKWRSIAAAAPDADEPFVVVNGAEGEPGTFKDRSLFRANPHLVLEGALIAAHCIGARRIVVATKAAYRPELERIRAAATELAEAGVLVDERIEIVEGPDHYLYGEETALLEVIEGEDPLPRQLPPYLYGLFTTSVNLGWSSGHDDSPGGPAEESSNPALVNNVETYAHVALVCRHGADWYRSMGTPESPGPTIVTITGDVQRAVVAEIELGTPLREVIDTLTGGAAPGRTIKAVLSGVSNRVLTEADLDRPVTYEDLAAAGGGLGSAGFMVFDDSRNMVDVAYQVSRFLHIESCGQCNPCKTGTQAITGALEEIMFGDGRSEDIDVIRRRLLTVNDASRCYLPTQEQIVVTSLLQRFPEDLDIRLLGEPGEFEVMVPKLVDIIDGVAHSDPMAHLKRPDWTYGEMPVAISTR